MADNYIRLLTTAARRTLFMTAAGPGQPGVNHFNCQPKPYWIAKVEFRGLRFDAAATADFESMARAAGLPPWFGENLLIFAR